MKDMAKAQRLQMTDKDGNEDVQPDEPPVREVDDTIIGMPDLR
jgi:hypothetical protein